MSKSPFLIRVLIPAVILFASSPLSAQSSSSWCIDRGYAAEGAIVVGSITKSEIDPAGHKSKATVTVTDSLRGDLGRGDSITVPVDWTPGTAWEWRPPIWLGVRSDVGKHLLLMFWITSEVLNPACVIDADSDPAALNVVKRMLELDKTPQAQMMSAMETALSDSEIAVRNHAIDYLTGPNMRDPQARLKVLRRFAPIASHPQNPRHLEALGFIERAYDPWSPDSSVNWRILSFMANRLADSDPRARHFAVQSLDSIFFNGGRQTLSPARLRFTNREGAKRKLKHDIATWQVDDPVQARRILKLLSQSR